MAATNMSSSKPTVLATDCSCDGMSTAIADAFHEAIGPFMGSESAT
jgi:hypothetical protein